MFKPINSVFQNWSKDLYIASKTGVEYDDYNNQIVKYDEPHYFGKVNYQPLTKEQLEAYMKEYGETSSSIICGLIDYYRADDIKEFDLAYLYGATPENENINGENANYVVKAFKPQNTKIMIMFEKIIKEVNDGSN